LIRFRALLGSWQDPDQHLRSCIWAVVRATSGWLNIDVCGLDFDVDLASLPPCHGRMAAEFVLSSTGHRVRLATWTGSFTLSYFKRR
jgi:hypothetical protein